MIKGQNSLADFRGITLSATCINIMARFVQVARHKEGKKIHLQDKNVLARVSNVAQNTDNQHLRLLYQRLSEELSNAHRAADNKAVTTNSASKLKGWSQIFK